ncbi:hypothetical protein C9J48_11695 [Photobacterium profundum]|uniref:Uncharacterized protein n=1 Tax=Photobacterium profundum 3TCK TaxID=314280 RepID=Q1YZ01_9GAMM|nr:hypothetical protein [Photobacterium profundum]EAS41540.1 hypothetical protein P3TCK_07856 [Photobacterium profundum 3TCK]PSV62607.1 hypothetical protein C9J48_11695 [Photobacterium profundum]
MINQFHINIELQHIYLEVHAERFHYLRNFFESYYCYQHNLVTKKGKMDWEGIFQHAQRSKSARDISNRKQLVREMTLPLPVLTGMLKVLVRDDEASIDNIQCLLDTHLSYVVITREEHLMLKKAGLLERMPATYYQEKSTNFHLASSRFTAVDITF